MNPEIQKQETLNKQWTAQPDKAVHEQAMAEWKEKLKKMSLRELRAEYDSNVRMDYPYVPNPASEEYVAINAEIKKREEEGDFVSEKEKKEAELSARWKERIKRLTSEDLIVIDKYFQEKQKHGNDIDLLVSIAWKSIMESPKKEAALKYLKQSEDKANKEAEAQSFATKVKQKLAGVRDRIRKL